MRRRGILGATLAVVLAALFASAIGAIEGARDTPRPYVVRVPGVANDVPHPQPAGRPLTYTHYDFADPEPFASIEIGVTWEVVPEDGYVYAAFQFAFEGHVIGGYMGPQIYGPGRGFHFSIWDDVDNSGNAQPASQTCQRFTHEGTGTMCHVESGWVEGREYRLRLSSLGADGGGEGWAGTVVDSVTGTETTVGIIRVANILGRSGYGRLESWGHTFMEYFGGPTTCSGQPYSQVLWHGPFAGPAMEPATSAIASHAPCPFANVTSPGPPNVRHAAGALTPRTTAEAAELW